MCGWIKTEISWVDHMRSEEGLPIVEEKRSILSTVKSRKADWIGYILRRNCLLKHVINGKI